MSPILRQVKSLVQQYLRLIKYHLRRSKTQNENLSYRITALLLLGLLTVSSLLFISNALLFNVDNFSTFKKESEVLVLFVKLSKIFRTKAFLRQFKYLTEGYTNSKHSKDYSDDYGTIFNYNLSNAAYLNHLVRAYEQDKIDPLSYLQENRLDFHWADWSDISKALPLVNTYDDILNSDIFEGNDTLFHDYLHRLCYDRLLATSRTSRATDESYMLTVHDEVQSVAIYNAILKYYQWPVPQRMFFESEKEYFEIYLTKDKRLKHPIGIQGLSKIYHGKSKVNSRDIKSFINDHDRQSLLDKLIKLSEERSKHVSYKIKDFPTSKTPQKDEFIKPNLEAELKKYRAIENPTFVEKKYLKFLETNQINQGIQKLYFNVPMLRADPSGSLHHYGIPFFREILALEERVKIVHHLIRSWFKFSEMVDVISWFNYGNLIGWYFFSMNLPWDNDADVQISIKGLEKLAHHYNNTLVIEDPNLGDSTFFLHVNPYYLQNNGEQFIDARYLDTRTGIYIDISGVFIDDKNTAPDKLGELKDENDFNVHCQHNNWFKASDLFPLRRTLYEGGLAYTVNNYKKMMINIYGSDYPLKQRNEGHHNWQEDLGLWVRNEICEKQKIPLNRFDEDGQLTLFGACNDTELLETWRNTRKVWKTHVKEFELIEAGDDALASEVTSKPLPIYRYFDLDQFR